MLELRISCRAGRQKGFDISKGRHNRHSNVDFDLCPEIGSQVIIMSIEFQIRLITVNNFYIYDSMSK